jgi:hypothetical protein
MRGFLAPARALAGATTHQVSSRRAPARPTLATTPNFLILMPLSLRQGGHRASMAGTIGRFGIGWVGVQRTSGRGSLAVRMGQGWHGLSADVGSRLLLPRRVATNFAGNSVSVRLRQLSQCEFGKQCMHLLRRVQRIPEQVSIAILAERAFRDAQGHA